MGQAAGPSPSRGTYPVPEPAHHRAPFVVRLLARLFPILMRIWAVVVLGGLAFSALLVLLTYGAGGLIDPGKYLLIYVLILLFYSSPVITLAIVGMLLVLTVLGALAHFTGYAV